MRILHPVLALAMAVAIIGCASESKQASRRTTDRAAEMNGSRTLRSVEEFRPQATIHGGVLTVPHFESTPEAVQQAGADVIRHAESRLTDFVAQDRGVVTFSSSIAALDSIGYDVVTVLNRMYLIMSVWPEANVREAAQEQVKQLQEWLVGLTYRQDVYEVCKAFEKAYESSMRSRLVGEDLKLYKDTMRDYRRAGMHLSSAQRSQVEDLQKRLTNVSADFSKNIADSKVIVDLQPYELEGVPSSILESLSRSGEAYQVEVTNVAQYLGVIQNCPIEETRRRLKVARYSIAMDQNRQPLEEMIALRHQIASLLGYKSWDDYQTEIMMAGTGSRALNFLLDLSRGLQPKFESEIEELRQMKVSDTGDQNAQLMIWDFRYYQNELKKRKYDIDTQELRNFFELNRTLAGMFEVYETIFDLKFERIDAPQKWVSDLTLWMCSDGSTGEPLGMFYLDLFPRDGKYKHFAQFDIIGGKRIDARRYQRPIVALVCNFSPPTGDKPSLLTHDEVETLFHEFGHALHSIVTRADFARFAGTNVPRDFVEAPSQMLEAWVWDTTVLNRFAADYRNPSRKIDPSILKRMTEAKLATIGVFYRRQLCFGIGDQRVHGTVAPADVFGSLNYTMAEIFLAPPDGTAFAATFGHLDGYSGSYYGYAWADAISSDMATVFENAKDRYMSKEVGMRLRNEIYAVGGSRDVEESIRIFLQRDRSLQPFFEDIGLKK